MMDEWGNPVSDQCLVFDLKILYKNYLTESVASVQNQYLTKLVLTNVIVAIPNPIGLIAQYSPKYS